MKTLQRVKEKELIMNTLQMVKEKELIMKTLQIGKETNIPISTVYRRLQLLQENKMVKENVLKADRFQTDQDDQDERNNYWKQE